MIGRLLVAACLFAGTAHAEPLRAPSCKAKVGKKTVRTLADIDWCNFDFGFLKGPLRNGHHSLHLYAKLGGPHDTIHTSFKGVAYGDGNKLAAVILQRTIRSGATDNASSSQTIYIYKLVRSKPVLLGSIDPIGGVTAVSFAANGGVTVTWANKTTTQYRLDKGDYVEVTQP